jgi:hypothetical protein
MSNASLLDQLDKGIDALLSGANVDVPAADPAVAELLAVADGLCTSVRPDFKAQLKSDLLGPSAPKSNAAVACPIVIATETTRRERPADAMPANPLPTLAGSGYGLYPVQSRSFMASLGAHVLMLALLVTSGIWAAPSFREKPRVTSTVVTDLSHIFPPASDRTRGGGGGDSDPLPASKGSPPRFDRQQIAPPAIVVRSEQPKLPAESTVVGAPALRFPQTAQMGDPFSHVSGLPFERDWISRGDWYGRARGRRSRIRTGRRHRMGRRLRKRSLRGRTRSDRAPLDLRSRAGLLR